MTSPVRRFDDRDDPWGSALAPRRRSAATRGAPQPLPPICGNPGMQMVGRPHTKVERSVPRLGDGWVLFPPLSVRWLRKGRVLPASDLARLDERWASLGFVGATAVVPVTEHDLDLDLGRDPDVVVCEDEDLNANVRLRLRGRLLLGDMPLIEQTEPLVGAARGVRGAERRIAVAGLLCGDERLHAAVVEGRHRRFDAPEAGLALAAHRSRTAKAARESIRRRWAHLETREPRR